MTFRCLVARSTLRREGGDVVFDVCLDAATVHSFPTEAERDGFVAGVEHADDSAFIVREDSINIEIDDERTGVWSRDPVRDAAKRAEVKAELHRRFALTPIVDPSLPEGEWRLEVRQVRQR